MDSSEGLLNNQGTLGMARTNDPNSATRQFYVNVADNNFLDGTPGGNEGYAVFGEVDVCYSVVEEISLVKTDGNDQPIEDEVMWSVSRL